MFSLLAGLPDPPSAWLIMQVLCLFQESIMNKGSENTRCQGPCNYPTSTFPFAAARPLETLKNTENDLIFLLPC